MVQDTDKFIRDQLSVWPAVAANYRYLKRAKTRQIETGGLNVTIQFNPGRIRSSKADAYKSDDPKCLLCAENRPARQKSFKIECRKGRLYDVTVNPYPIFPKHFVIARDIHVPQTIWHRYVDMLDVAFQFQDCVVMYNGPSSGASIPGHMHFQACARGYLPLERSVDRMLSNPLSFPEDIVYVASVQDAELYHYKHFARGIFALRAPTAKSMAKMFYRLLDCAEIAEGETEPRFNVITWYTSGEYRAAVIMRRSHRPSHYFAEGEGHFTTSPGCADMAGWFVLPEASDFERLDQRYLREIIDDVTLTQAEEEHLVWRLVRSQRKIEVGIVSAAKIRFEIISDGAGPQQVSYCEGKIKYNGALYDELYFEAQTISTLFAEPSFILHDVVIGVGFHWERRQSQTFAGTLKFIVESGKVTAVNVIGVEDYLLSVISSEMKASASLEFLKAHAVISRSWVMAMAERRRNRRSADKFAGPGVLPDMITWLDSKKNGADATSQDGALRIVKWFDDCDHKLFDVCADDHCQRYQGLTMAVGKNVRRAVDETWGRVLKYDGKLCDTRFSKCCGGLSELYSTCWEDIDYPYLQPVEDPFCNTSDEAVLSQVLNDYDLETKDFYAWEAEYGVDELSSLISTRLGKDIGKLEALIPLEKGPSGRIKLLRVKGDTLTVDVGKELMIRKILSTSHLKSSAFEAEFRGDRVILHGRGWGHGVGLCQIGAARMGHLGYPYNEILALYYPGAKTELIDTSKDEQH